MTNMASAPRSGNGLTRALARGMLRVAGWRIEGEVPDEPKLVLVGAPHTTNLDFVLTKLTAGALGLRVFWVGKQSLFPRWVAPLARVSAVSPSTARRRSGSSRRWWPSSNVATASSWR